MQKQRIKKRITKRQVNIPTTIPQGFPSRAKVKLFYEDLFAITPSNTYGNYIYRGNSLFDPDYTATGHQPRYFDTYASVYSKYKVVASKITLDMINFSSAASAIVVILPNTLIATTYTTWKQLSELPLAKASHIIPVASRKSYRMSSSCSTSRVLGLLPGQLNDEDLSAETTTNPASLWYWNIAAYSMDQASNVDVQIRIRIEYESMFYERIETAIS